DMNGDGYSDLVISAGFGGGPRISIFDGQSLTHDSFGFLTQDFFAFDPSLRDGAFVGVGDVNGDGFADLIAGGGPGGSPRVLVLSGQTLVKNGFLNALRTPIANFFGGDPSSRNGVTVSARNLDNDGRADVLIGDGSTVVALQGEALAQ